MRIEDAFWEQSVFCRSIDRSGRSANTASGHFETEQVIKTVDRSGRERHFLRQRLEMSHGRFSQPGRLSRRCAFIDVLSTTFASVERMFSDLSPEALGWLLIDEAGQATPQAAVGAILRAKRSIVVGDPLQIQPVVSLPKRLNTGICDFFNLDQPDWAAPDASAQTLTDRASRYQASLNSDAGERRVGLPLLVHRRCQDPMFSI